MIYIVEDDENIREMESYALKNSGYDVKGFACGDELRAALAAVERLDAEGLCELATGYVDEDDLISGLMEEEDVAVNPLLLAIPIIICIEIHIQSSNLANIVNIGGISR